MKIQSIQTIHGPNVFHHRPVLSMLLDLEELSECPSNEIPGFQNNLLHYLPGLEEHHCSPGYPGGFVERLERGTFPGHIVEHVALELSNLCGIGANYGKTVYGGQPGVYRVVVRFQCEEGMRELLKTAVSLTEAAAFGLGGFPLAQKLADVKALVQHTALGPSTRAIVEAAEERNIPWQRLNEENLIQLGYGRGRRLIQATTTSCTSDIAVDIAQDKALTKKLLESAAIPVPQGRVACTEEEAVRAFVELGGRVVVKPFDGNHGRAVSLHLGSAEEVRAAFRDAIRGSRSVIVEEFIPGQDFRVLVVDGKMVAASERTPAYVSGDGIHTIEELVELENQNPLRGVGHEKPLTKILLDECALACLARRQLNDHSLPAAGERVPLRDTANLSTGGTATDVTDQVHPDLRLLCERAARVIGLDVCGIDLITENISRASHEQKTAVIEVNSGPGIRMHHFPSFGQSRNVGAAILESLYPTGQTGRIPIVSITGTNGKTTVARLTSHVLEGGGQAIGLTTTDGIFLNGQAISHGDTTGPASARALLSDPGIDIAVLETARGGIVRRGLGYDWSDVGVITNIQPDHIGQDGIESLEDIFRIKSLVAERVREGGTIVLNAEDEPSRRLIEKYRFDPLRRHVALFSTSGELPLVRSHLARGGNAYICRKENIFELTQNKEHWLGRAADFPITFSGTANFQIANVLAAVAATRALGVPLSTIVDRLHAFFPSLHNSGRANVFRVGKGLVMIDYGHNPDAFRAICAMTERWRSHRVTGVIGVPGDRSDQMIRDAGRAAARGFDRVILRDDQDLRGRRSGEVAEILRAAIQEESPETACELIPCTRRAMENALLGLEENEVVVVFYEELKVVQEVLERFNARRLENFTALTPELAHAAWKEVS